MLAPHTTDEWQEVELARWVPRSMETLLRIKPYSTTPQPPWMMAIARALPESRKMEIIPRVPEDQKLVSVLIRRGWVQDARKELIEMLHSGRPLEDSTVWCIAGLRDPSTWDALLRRLEQNPETGLYSILRLAMASNPVSPRRCAATISRITIQGREPAGIPSHNDEVSVDRFTTCAMHGLPEALAHHLALYRWFLKEPGRDYLTERLNSIVAFPPGVKPRTKEAREFLLNLKPNSAAGMHCPGFGSPKTQSPDTR